jgi:hypothetical protein
MLELLVSILAGLHSVLKSKRDPHQGRSFGPERDARPTPLADVLAVPGHLRE